VPCHIQEPKITLFHPVRQEAPVEPFVKEFGFLYFLFDVRKENWGNKFYKHIMSIDVRNFPSGASW
jgi:hypothetical protein